MPNNVSLWGKSKNIKIMNSSVNVEVGTVKQAGTAKQDKLELFFDAVSLNAIRNADGRADEVRCYHGTREEIISKVERWMDGRTEQRHGMLWLTGPAGAGKSAIAQTVAERAAERRVDSTNFFFFRSGGHRIPTANFFFFRGDNSRNHAPPLVPTLVYQLVDFYPALRQHVSDCLMEKPLTLKASIEEQFARLVGSPFQHIRRSSYSNRKIIIIIDGLDECNDEAAQEQILNALHALVTMNDSPFRVMVASRAEPHLVMFFNNIRESVESILLNDEYQPQDDIRKFVAAKFDDIKRTHHLASTLKDRPIDEDIDKIVAKSSGQFVYAATVMRFIERSKDSPVASLLQVHEIRLPTNHSPFSQLDALYSHVFSRARDIRAIKWAIGFHLMQLDVAGYRMLRTCGYETFDLESLFADISAIAQISVDPHGRLDVLFYHASLPDYLMNESRSQIYHLDGGKILEDALTICLLKFRDAESFESVCEVVAKVKQPSRKLYDSLLDASERRLGLDFSEQSYFWEKLIHAIIGLYFSGDEEQFRRMLQSWLRFAYSHKLDTSIVQRRDPEDAYRYYDSCVVAEKARLDSGAV